MASLSKSVCTNCRLRKIKCHRQVPLCSFCQEAGLQCSYDQVQKKRGLRAGYVASLEERLEKLEGEMQIMKRHFQNEGRRRESGFAITAPSSTPHVGSSPGTGASHGLTSPEQDTRSIEEILRLPAESIDSLCNIWFVRYHPWFPILHRLSFSEYLESRNSPYDSASLLVLKAILAVTLSHGRPSELRITEEWRDEMVSTFRKEILIHMSTDLSLSSLQAGLIVAIVDYGAGNLHTFWNEIAVCKRVGIQLGLLDLVSNNGEDVDTLSTISPRMLTLPRTVVEQEERIRAYWMTEVLDSISTLGTGWNLSISPFESHALLPCNEIVWAFPERTVDDTSLLNFGHSSLVSLYVTLVTGSLAKVHASLRQKFDNSSTAHEGIQQEHCIALDAGLNKWRQSKEVVETLSSHSSTDDPLFILINATLQMATIIIYQRLALPVTDAENQRQPWYHGIQRCLDACNILSTNIKALSEESLENNCPHLVSCIFVAARFLLVRSRIVQEDLPRCFDILLYGLNVCSQRWYFANRLEKVLRSAVVEKNRPLSESALPSQFYDLRYSSVDIDEALRLWAVDY